MNKFFFVGAMLLFSHRPLAGPVVTSVEVDLSAEQAFTLWTTDEGVQSFLAPGSVIEAGVGGKYDIYFFPTNAAGKRGAEGTRILIYEPNTRLVFTWDQPTLFPQVRGQHSWVSIDFKSLDNSRTEVVLRHDGFGDSEQWRGAKAYFEAAWPVVLKRFAWVIDNGAMDWNEPPSELMYQPNMESILDRAKSI